MSRLQKTRRARGRKSPLRRTLLLLMNIVIFPVGIVKMWDRRCRWPLCVKGLVSAVCLAAVIVYLLPQYRAPELATGGVVIIGKEINAEVYGPAVPTDLPDRVFVAPESIIVDKPVTVTAEPIVVYANKNGQYYHEKTCRYVNDETPRTTVSYAISIGYLPCPECNPNPGY